MSKALNVEGLTGLQRGKKYSFEGRAVVFGTSNVCDVRFDPVWDKTVSSEHATLRFERNQWVIEDQSKQGTYIAGRRLVREPLPADSTIELGRGGPKIRLTVVGGRVAGPGRAQPGQGLLFGFPTGAVVAVLCALAVMCVAGLWYYFAHRNKDHDEDDRHWGSRQTSQEVATQGGNGTDRQQNAKAPQLSGDEQQLLTAFKTAPMSQALMRFWGEIGTQSPYTKGLHEREDEWLSTDVKFLAHEPENKTALFPGIFVGEFYSPDLVMPGSAPAPEQMLAGIQTAVTGAGASGGGAMVARDGVPFNPHDGLGAGASGGGATFASLSRAEKELPSSLPAVNRLRERFNRAAGKEAGAASPQEAKAWAVVVGINDYEASAELHLNCCRNDAAALAKVLSTQGIFEMSRVRLLTDGLRGTPQYASKQNVLAAINETIAAAAPQDVVFLSFSCHGGYDKESHDSYFYMADSRNPGTALSGNELESILAKAKARNVLIAIDACHSGGIGAIGGGQQSFAKAARSFADKAQSSKDTAKIPDEFYEKLASARGHVVIRACRADQTSLDLPPVGQGLFTLVLLEGLTGDADLNHDGIVTLSELRIFVTTAIPKISRYAGGDNEPGGPMEPTFTSSAFGEAGDLPLTVVTPANNKPSTNGRSQDQSPDGSGESPKAAGMPEWKPVADMDEVIFPAFILATATVKIHPLDLINNPDASEGATEDQNRARSKILNIRDSANGAAPKPHPVRYGDPRSTLGIEIVSPAPQTKVEVSIKENELMAASHFEAELPEGGKSYRLYPSVNYRYDLLRRVRQTIPLSVVMDVTVNGVHHEERTKAVRVASINECPTALILPSGSRKVPGAFVSNKGVQYLPIEWMFSAYVNENHPISEQIRQEAIKTGLVDDFQGYTEKRDGESEAVKMERLGYTWREVFAVWNVLRRRGVHYSSIAMTPMDSEEVWSQTVRFIDQSIDNAQANCVDGTVIFASALRQIGVEPILEMPPGHCFLGFFSERGGEERFLETTMIGFRVNDQIRKLAAAQKDIKAALDPIVKTAADRDSEIVFLAAITVGFEKHGECEFIDAAKGGAAPGSSNGTFVNLAWARNAEGILPIGYEPTAPVALPPPPQKRK